MSNTKIFDLEHKIKKDLEATNIKEMTANARLSGQIHDTVIPMINEVIMSVSDSSSYEDAYKMLVDKLRAMHEIIVNQKIGSEQQLLKAMGKVEANKEILADLSILADEIRDQQNQERVNSIAEKIQSGTLDPNAPRKIGSRPEKIKNIREAKRTLFGAPSPPNDTDD